MKKRILSLVLTAAMLLTLVPVFATTAAAEETYTITYVDAQSGLGANVTQEITGTGLVYGNKQGRISGSAMFTHWEGSDGNKYGIGEAITPTSDLTLTAKYTSQWANYTYLSVATANFANAELIEFGDYYRLDTTITYKSNGYSLDYDPKGYTNTGLTTKNVGGTTTFGNSNTNNNSRLGSANPFTVFNYGEIARPGDGTNGLGVPTGYKFSHYILVHNAATPFTSYENVDVNGYTRQKAYDSLARAIENNAYTPVYVGDTIHPAGSGVITVTRGSETISVASTWATNTSLWLVPIFEKVEVSYNTIYNANFGETPTTTNVASLTVPENTFVNEGHEFLFWCTEANGSGLRYYPGDVLQANNMTLYAIWGVAGQVNVIYLNGETTEIVSGETVTAKTLEKYGYNFAGWKTLDTEETVTYAAGEAITANCIVEPTWTLVNYKITFAHDYGLPEGEKVTFTKFNGDLITNGLYYSAFGPATKLNGVWTVTGGSNTENYFCMVREGYTFLGWSNQPGGKGELNWLVADITDGYPQINTTFLTAAKAQALYDANYGSFTFYPIWLKDGETEPELPEIPAEITLKEDATLVLGEEYVTGLTVGMTVEAFLAQFATEGLAVLNADGEAVTEGAMATGYTVALVVNGEVVDSYIVVVYGDVDGDGIVNVNDIVAVRDYISGSKLDAANVAAANADRDEENLVNVNDIVAIRDHISGTEINQK